MGTTAHESSADCEIDDAYAFGSALQRLLRSVIYVGRYLEPGLAFVQAVKAVKFLPLKSIAVRSANGDFLPVELFGISD